MKENYFDYGSHIESKRISEAIAMPAGSESGNFHAGLG